MKVGKNYCHKFSKNKIFHCIFVSPPVPDGQFQCAVLETSTRSATGINSYEWDDWKEVVDSMKAIFYIKTYETVGQSENKKRIWCSENRVTDVSDTTVGIIELSYDPINGVKVEVIKGIG